MKYAFILLMFLISFSTIAQKKDLIITGDNDSLVCEITKVDNVSITYYENISNNLKWIPIEKVEKYEWNTKPKITNCDKGVVITNNGEKIAGTLFINTNSYGIEIDRPFMNSISTVCLKNETAFVYDVSELIGFNYCNTMYMRVQTKDSSYQFVEILESGKTLILAKGVNPSKYKWKEDRSNWFKLTNPITTQRNEEFDLGEQTLSYVRVKQTLTSVVISMATASPNSEDTDRTHYYKGRKVEYKYADEVYYLIKKGKLPVEVNSNNFSVELENLMGEIREEIVEARWTEEGMIREVKLINIKDE